MVVLKLSDTENDLTSHIVMPMAEFTRIAYANPHDYM